MRVPDDEYGSLVRGARERILGGRSGGHEGTVPVLVGFDDDHPGVQVEFTVKTAVGQVRVVVYSAGVNSW